MTLYVEVNNPMETMNKERKNIRMAKENRKKIPTNTLNIFLVWMKKLCREQTTQTYICNVSMKETKQNSVFWIIHRNKLKTK